MKRAAWTGIVLILGLAALLPQRSTAQNEGGPERKPEVKEARRALPFPFGRLGLSDSQKEELYAVHASYDEKIAPLEQQIEKLKRDRDQAFETVLTPGQKLRMQELREEARLRDEERLKSAQAGKESSASERDRTTP